MSPNSQGSGSIERSLRLDEDPHSKPITSAQVTTLNNSQTPREPASSGLPLPAVYRMTFRHVNCQGPMREADDPPSRDVCDLTIPTWPSSVPYNLLNQLESMPYDIGSWTFDPDAPIHYRETPSCQTCPFSVYCLLVMFSRQYYADNVTHHDNSKEGHEVRVVSARIVWADPRPAIRDASEDPCAARFIIVSKEHLALVQARGHVDHIHVEFETQRPRTVLEKYQWRYSETKIWIRRHKADIKEALMRPIAVRVLKLYVER
ncbi:hypothetical protein F5X97DRAFT_110207 [Nemania serpens]|nr:hypothetical protein F5X97DRAFT_110207 [Nemania serpens]